MNSDEQDTGFIDPGKRQLGVRYPAPFAELAVALGASARREIRIISPKLDHAVFDTAEMTDALSALARRDSRSRVRILISDPRLIISRGHRLLNLARRIPSAIALRKLENHPEMTGETFVSRDLDGILFSPEEESPGFYDPDSGASAQRFIDKFERLWERAVEEPQFRRLGL